MGTFDWEISARGALLIVRLVRILSHAPLVCWATMWALVVPPALPVQPIAESAPLALPARSAASATHKTQEAVLLSVAPPLTPSAYPVPTANV